jgi:hypothetical protein
MNFRKTLLKTVERGVEASCDTGSISKERRNARFRFERDWAKGEERIRSLLH